MIDGNADGAAAGFTFCVQEAGKDVLVRAGRFAAGEWDENDFVSRGRIAVPRPMLTDDGATAILGEKIGRVERQPQRCRV